MASLPSFSHMLQTFLTHMRAWGQETYARFFDDDDTITIPNHTDSFNIPHMFSVIVGMCAIIVYPLALTRTQMNEAGDRFLVMAIICTAFLTFLLLHFFPTIYARIRQFWGAQVTLVLLVSVFVGLGFREDDFYTEFVGFGSVMLGVLVVLVIISSILRYTPAQRIITPLTMLLSGFVVSMGVVAVFINLSLTDNFYIINDMLLPLTHLKAYTDYIPGYVNLFQHFPRVLDSVGITAYPQLTMYIIYLFLEVMCIAAIIFAVYFNYRYMVKKSIWIAILFSVPLFFISTLPFWDYSKKYYTLQLFFYSMVPVRMFTIFSVGTLCMVFLHHANTNLKTRIGYGFLCGLVASIGMYQTNDFGLFALIAVGVAIIFQPLQSWTTRITLAGIYAISVVISLCLLLVLNTDLATLNPDYIYIWIRKSVAGYGSVLIMFPGNGLMVITTLIAIWLCTAKIYLILQKHPHAYAHDGLIANHFAALVYIASVAVMGMSYYINHSVISFQGSSMYIGMSVAAFMLYQLVQRMASTQPVVARTVTYANITPSLFVVLPLMIALIHTPIANRLNQNEMAIKRIVQRDPSAMVDTAEYNELRIAQFENIYAQLQPLQMRVAFVGSFANIVELYTGIPAASILIHPSTVEIGATVRHMYCDHMDRAPYDVFLSDQGYACEEMQVLASEPLGAYMYVRPDFAQTHSVQWQQLRDIANVCPIDMATGEVRCPTP